MRSLFFLILFVSLLVACNKDPKANKVDYIKLKSTEINSEEIPIKGKILLKNKCYLCQSPRSSEGSRIAPPMSSKHDATIKRVSDKNRNPNNKANAQELDYISLHKQILKNGEEPEPIVVEENKRVNFYYRIVTTAMLIFFSSTK